MRDRTKVAIATAALVVAGVGGRAAQAQNYFTAPAIPYFSIAIPVFHKGAYTGPTPPVGPGAAVRPVVRKGPGTGRQGTVHPVAARRGPAVDPAAGRRTRHRLVEAHGRHGVDLRHRDEPVAPLRNAALPALPARDPR